jgi:hypothetical protein
MTVTTEVNKGSGDGVFVEGALEPRHKLLYSYAFHDQYPV